MIRKVGEKSFEDLVAEAVDELPEPFAEALENVAIVVEEWPDRQTMHMMGVSHRSQLLGLYHGIPHTARSRGYSLVMPDKISIYRQPILLRCRNDEDVRALVKRVVRHEIAHHFGIDDDRLHEIGAY